MCAEAQSQPAGNNEQLEHSKLETMAQNEAMAARLRASLATRAAVTEKNMFRGTAFLVNGKLAFSTGNDELMLRFDPAMSESVLAKPGTRPMVMKGKELKGYAYVHESEIATEKQLAYWVELGLAFNEKAKASRKKKSS